MLVILLIFALVVIFKDSSKRSDKKKDAAAVSGLRKAKFDAVLTARTIGEQEALLVEILKDPAYIPERDIILFLILAIQKDHFHRGHEILFEDLLYHGRLSSSEISAIQKAYSGLDPVSDDMLTNCIIKNTVEAAVV